MSEGYGVPQKIIMCSKESLRLNDTRTHHTLLFPLEKKSSVVNPSLSALKKLAKSFFHDFLKLTIFKSLPPPHTHTIFVGALMNTRFLKSSLENIATSIIARITLSHRYFWNAKLTIYKKKIHYTLRLWADFFLNSHFMFNIWFQKSYGCEWLRFLSISGNVGGLIRPWSQLLKKNGPHSTYRSFNERSNIPHLWGDCHQHVAFLLSSK